MPRKPAAEVDDRVYEMEVRICKAFANSTRLRLMDMLSGGELPVSELQDRLKITAPNMSQHLGILKTAGVVSTRREGKLVFCRLTLPEVSQACSLIRNVLRAQLKSGRDLVV